MNGSATFSALAEALAGPLPGDEVKSAMWPAPVTGLRRPPADQPAVPAAVLILLFEEEGEVRFPLLRRTSVDGDVHSGQISLPGGRVETGETAVVAALRETREEIGVGSEGIEILGRLSPHYIPVSGYEVTPVVGACASRPRFVPHEAEVESVMVTSVQELRSGDRRSTFSRHFPGRGTMEVPCWRLEGGILWGATAMILTELLALWDRLWPARSAGG